MPTQRRVQQHADRRARIDATGQLSPGRPLEAPRFVARKLYQNGRGPHLHKLGQHHDTQKHKVEPLIRGAQVRRHEPQRDRRTAKADRSAQYRPTNPCVPKTLQQRADGAQKLSRSCSIT